jgi:prophage antirepressor-like protein
MTTKPPRLPDDELSDNNTLVSEAGLYRLIMVSETPFAKQFQHWLFHEVLPEIRRTGGFHGEPGQLENLLAPIFKNLVIHREDTPPPESKR